MSEQLFDYLDEVLQRYFGADVGFAPLMRRADVEQLLTDDTRRRLAEARSAAVEWGNAEIRGSVEITSECLVITHQGLLYAAGLNGVLAASARQPLFYLAAPPVMYEPIVERVDSTPLLQGSAAAVDDRFGHELTFPWPLDGPLRRLLDSHQVLRLDLTGHDHPAPATGTP